MLLNGQRSNRNNLVRIDKRMGIVIMLLDVIWEKTLLNRKDIQHALHVRMDVFVVSDQFEIAFKMTKVDQIKTQKGGN